uniref:Dynein heavy chain linker domain-containing protein n=1 Tax=Echeneis naucrates TaxID=173247 RepID=A0A665TVC1_ECHNA
MATSEGVFKPTSLFPVLPPIEGTDQQHQLQIAAAKEQITERLSAHRKLLRHRRRRVQQDKLRLILFWLHLQMNYMFLRQCVESRPFTPLQQQWLDSIVSRVPTKFKESPEANILLHELCMEVSDACLSMPYLHPLVDSVLRNPQIEGLLSEKQSTVQTKILDFSQPWHNNFIRSREMIKTNLHILHPAMRTVLDISHMAFSPLVLVDLSGCRASGPVDCKSLENKMTVECKRTEDRIMNNWFPKVIHLLTSKETLNVIKEEKLDSFYDCASTLISNQLKSMLQTSVEEFVSLFEPSNHHRLPIFRMALTFDDEKMEIYPTILDLEASVSEILNTITKTLQKVQTVQSWLAQTTSSFVDAKVADHILAWAQATLKTAVCRNLEEPDKHFQNYVVRFDWLVNGTAQTEVEMFMEEEHCFNEYVKKVEEFHALSKEIISLPAKAHFTMVHLDCEELKQGLSSKAKTYAEIVLKKMINSHREKNLQICSEFETIREKALRVPETTEDMTQMVEYINVIKTKGIKELNEKILVCRRRISFHTLEPEDLELNSTVFLWPKNILHVFELNEQVTTAKQRGEQELLAKRERLMIHLEKLGRRSEQFPYCSELDMMQQYVTDIRTVQKFLQDAKETIDFINKEETFYKWEQTSYPELEVIRENIEPYQKLFGLVLKWQRTENRWMDGSFQDLDGENMEVKVDEFFREIIKMLKFFQQKQNKAEREMVKIAGKPRERSSEDDSIKKGNPTILVCSTVMEQIKEFKVF